MTFPVFLNEADERTPLPYVVVSSTHTPTRGLMSNKLADTVAFNFTCYGVSASQAEEVADQVETLIYATKQLAMTGRTAGVDQDGGQDIAVVSAEAILDPGESIQLPVGGGGVVEDFDVAGFEDAGYDEEVVTGAGATTEFDVLGFDDDGFEETGTVTPDEVHVPDAACEEAVALLAAAPELLGVPVALNAVDESTSLPYIVVTCSHDPVHTIDGRMAADHVSFTIACWSTSAEEAEAMADAVEVVLGQDVLDMDQIAREGGFDLVTTLNVAIVTADRWV